MKEEIEIIVNGESYRIPVEPRKTLLELLREDIGLTGTKEGCSIGVCGACTVLLDGMAVKSCLILAVKANGKKVTTIEGLADGQKLHKIQESFIKRDALQCGFCTPGMIIASKALLDENPHPTEEEIKMGLVGNICRCTGYKNIIEAVLDVSKNP
jgi:carbon-monoxide dehydrogenase small subunit